MSAPDKPLADSVLTFLDAHIALLGLLDAYQQRQEVPDEDQFRTHLKTLQEHRSDAVIFLVRYSPTPGNYSTAQAECIVEGLCAAWASCLTQPWAYLDHADMRRIVQQLALRFVTAINLYEEGLKAQSTPPTNPPPPPLPTIWYHGERSYSADGANPICVSNEMHNLLKAFLDKTIALETNAIKGINNVADVVAKIISKFGEGAIRRPKQKGEGYFIRVCTLKATN